MIYTIYDTCPTLADKLLKKLKTHLKKEKLTFEISETVERTEHEKKRWTNYDSFEMIPANCTSINTLSFRKPARCKQCPLGIANTGRSHSDMTTTITPLSFMT